MKKGVKIGTILYYDNSHSIENNHLIFHTCIYTPDIYADGYIVFAFSFVCPLVRSFIRTSVTFVEFASKFCVKVSQVVYISANTHQKAFIFGP